MGFMLTRSTRLKPSAIQEAYFREACRASVLFYNLAIDWDKAHRNKTGKSLKKSELYAEFKKFKDSPAFDELNLSFSIETHTLREGVERYYIARSRGFKKNSGFPKKQSAKGKRVKSFGIRTDSLFILPARITIPGLYGALGKASAPVKYSWSGRKLVDEIETTEQYNARVRTATKASLGLEEPVEVECKPRIKSARVVWDGKYWFLQMAVEYDESPFEQPELNGAVGVDFGLTHFAVTSNGDFIEPVKAKARYRRLETRRKGLQRALARKRESAKKEGRSYLSQNYWKTLDKLNTVERDLTELTKAFRLDVAKKVVSANPRIVVLEDLSVKNMLKNKHLSSAIHQVGWYATRTMIEWEQVKKGGQVLVVDKFYPSSKTCSGCGRKKNKLALSERVYCCDDCGLIIDRDLNASLNLCKLGLNAVSVARCNASEETHAETA